MTSYVKIVRINSKEPFSSGYEDLPFALECYSELYEDGEIMDIQEEANYLFETEEEAARVLTEFEKDNQPLYLAVSVEEEGYRD